MQALLSEVRQLRQALERSSTVVPRLQLAIARYQMQQERVDRLERDLRSFRLQLASDLSGKEHLATALKQLEDQAAQSQDPMQRKQMEDATKIARAELEQQTVRGDQGRAQEQEMVSQLRAEEAKLSELNEQMNQMDRKVQQ